jgi:hypothetical protein
MTLEITNGKSRYQYRQDPENPCIIERRLNQAGRRWKFFTLRPTAADAQAAILKLELRERERTQP